MATSSSSQPFAAGPTHNRGSGARARPADKTAGLHVFTCKVWFPTDCSMARTEALARSATDGS